MMFCGIGSVLIGPEIRPINFQPLHYSTNEEACFGGGFKGICNILRFSLGTGEGTDNKRAFLVDLMSSKLNTAIKTILVSGLLVLMSAGIVTGDSAIPRYNEGKDLAKYRGPDPFSLYDPLKKSMALNDKVKSEIVSSVSRWNDPFKSLSYQLKVATFNIWGLIIAKDRADRVSAIARYFTKNPRGLDILCLQELWMADDYRTLRAALSLEFPHAHYFKSGVVGSGLAIFSKYPIEEAWWKGFTLTGKAHRLFDGDWYAGKGIGAVSIKHPVIGLIDIFNTHVRIRDIFHLFFIYFLVDC